MAARAFSIASFVRPRFNKLNVSCWSGFAAAGSGSPAGSAALSSALASSFLASSAPDWRRRPSCRRSSRSAGVSPAFASGLASSVFFFSSAAGSGAAGGASAVAATLPGFSGGSTGGGGSCGGRGDRHRGGGARLRGAAIDFPITASEITPANATTPATTRRKRARRAGWSPARATYPRRLFVDILDRRRERSLVVAEELGRDPRGVEVLFRLAGARSFRLARWILFFFHRACLHRDGLGSRRALRGPDVLHALGRLRFARRGFGAFASVVFGRCCFALRFDPDHFGAGASIFTRATLPEICVGRRESPPASSAALPSISAASGRR